VDDFFGIGGIWQSNAWSYTNPRVHLDECIAQPREIVVAAHHVPAHGFGGDAVDHVGRGEERTGLLLETYHLDADRVRALAYGARLRTPAVDNLEEVGVVLFCRAR
jgi:hypothetical protein